MLPPSAEALVRELTRLPGVGRRSAQRLAVHLLRVPEGDALQLATAIEEARARIQPCPECYGFAEDGLCPICRDTRRDDAMICVVEAPQDIDPIERSGAFRGRYHVLGGAISPIDGIYRKLKVISRQRTQPIPTLSIKLSMLHKRFLSLSNFVSPPLQPSRATKLMIASGR